MGEASIQSDQTLMAEVASRLRKTEQRAAAVVRALERQRSIQDSLKSADGGLHKAVAEIAELAKETKRATTAFDEAVSALRKTIKVLDDAALSSSFATLDQRTARIEAKQLAHMAEVSVFETLDQRTARIESNLKNLAERVNSGLIEVSRAVAAADQRTASMEKMVNKLSERVDTGLRQLRNAVAVTDQRTAGLETKVKELRKTVFNFVKQLGKVHSDIADTVVDRLRPRSVSEGLFGRRNG
ncbi:MAG: hypothetical protein OXN89_02185 [Bryobacterales bacterium]|nr:hypothetical protein [Bryobacterales bacterium]